MEREYYHKTFIVTLSKTKKTISWDDRLRDIFPDGSHFLVSNSILQIWCINFWLFCVTTASSGLRLRCSYWEMLISCLSEGVSYVVKLNRFYFSDSEDDELDPRSDRNSLCIILWQFDAALSAFITQQQVEIADSYWTDASEVGNSQCFDHSRSICHQPHCN